MRLTDTLSRVPWVPRLLCWAFMLWGNLSGREDYQSHQKTKVSILAWWEEKSFSLLHHQFPEVILYFPLNAWAEYHRVYVTWQNLIVQSNVFIFWMMRCSKAVCDCLPFFSNSYMLGGVLIQGITDLQSRPLWDQCVCVCPCFWYKLSKNTHSANKVGTCVRLFEG